MLASYYGPSSSAISNDNPTTQHRRHPSDSLGQTVALPSERAMNGMNGMMGGMPGMMPGQGMQGMPGMGTGGGGMMGQGMMNGMGGMGMGGMNGGMQGMQGMQGMGMGGMPGMGMMGGPGGQAWRQLVSGDYLLNVSYLHDQNARDSPLTSQGYEYQLPQLGYKPEGAWGAWDLVSH